MKRSRVNIKRRQLLRSILGYAALPPVVYAEKYSPAPQPLKSKIPNPNYKALVCLYLAGGNDSWNLLIPSGNEGFESEINHGYNTYYDQRRELAVKQYELRIPNKTITSPEENPYFHNHSASASYLKGMYRLNNQWSMNGCCPELAQLWQAGNLAWLANCGNLAESITRDNWEQQSKPPFLFAHNHQQRQLEKGMLSSNSATGWAGRVADLWLKNRDENTNHLSLGHLIGIDSNHAMLAAEDNSALVIPSSGLPKYNGISNHLGKRELLLSILNQGNYEAFGSLAAGTISNSINTLDYLKNEWPNTSSFESTYGLYGEELFSTPENALIGVGGINFNRLFNQLETTAKIIDIASKTGIERQIIAVRMGGFDTHANQLEKHPLLLRELSIGIGHFNQAMSQLGLNNQVTLFTQSEFSRTLQPNSSGTDHGWGGHQLISGGAVNKGVYGSTTDISTKSLNTVPDNRGRVIPDSSNIKTLNTLLTWLGLSDSEINDIFEDQDRSIYNGLLT